MIVVVKVLEPEGMKTVVFPVKSAVVKLALFSEKVKFKSLLTLVWVEKVMEKLSPSFLSNVFATIVIPLKTIPLPSLLAPGVGFLVSYVQSGFL